MKEVVHQKKVDCLFFYTNQWILLHLHNFFNPFLL